MVKIYTSIANIIRISSCVIKDYAQVSCFALLYFAQFLSHSDPEQSKAKQEHEQSKSPAHPCFACLSVISSTNSEPKKLFWFALKYNLSNLICPTGVCYSNSLLSSSPRKTSCSNPGPHFQNCTQSDFTTARHCLGNFRKKLLYITELLFPSFVHKM